MAYTYMIPRMDYFPPSPPYLAGLGDAAFDKYTLDLRVYQADMGRWSAEKAAYDRAQAAYLAAVNGAGASYGAAVARYQQDKAQWDKEAQLHSIAMSGYTRSMAQTQIVNAAASRDVAKAFGLQLPQSYFDNGACVSQADHDYAASHCTVVKGLGGALSYGDYCGIRRLPVCNFGKKPSLRPPPVAPQASALPARPAPLRSPPIPPSPVTPPPGATIPTSIPEIPTSIPEEATKQSNIVMGGLLAVAVVGGGYLIYRTFKGPKKAA